MTKQLEKVDFEIIRYANCWEDADILVKALLPDHNAHILSIASAGDNCFALLSQSPEKVIAFDVSAVQLYLTELKKVAIMNLDRAQYLAFSGFTDAKNRLEVYQRFSDQLSENAQNYWDQQKDAIKEGIIHTGKFERYFQLFKSDFLHKVHSQEIIDRLFEPKSDEAQKTFHDQNWHTTEWKKMYTQFFGKEMLGRAGRDPEFLKHVDGDVASLILQQEVDHLSTAKCQQNYFLYYILNNEFNGEFLPYYLRKENYDKVKNNLHKLTLYKGLLDEALETYPDCTHFNLSDIFEYMDEELFSKVSQKLISHSSEQARFAYWNLMLPRNMAKIFPDDIKNDPLAHDLKEKDLGYFYRKFIINEKV